MIRRIIAAGSGGPGAAATSLADVGPAMRMAIDLALWFAQQA